MDGHPPNPSRPSATRYDAVVVGARAAGAATSMLLARRGLRVLNVDRAEYGSDTLSSHALMRGAVSRLRRWGVLDAVLQSGTPLITRTVFGYGDAITELDIPADDEAPGLAAPRRTVLDRILVDAARDAGAEVLHRTRLLDVLRDAQGRVRGARLQLADGRTTLVSSDLLVGADGLHSAVARAVDAPITRIGHHASAYVLRYVAELDTRDDTFQWSFGPDVGAGVIPTNDATWCVFAALPPSHFARRRHDLATVMDDVLTACDPALASAFRRSVPVGPLRSWPGVTGRFRRPVGPGWALVGDAGYFKDPFAAHGITDAFRDAERLADAVLTDTLDRFERERDERSLPLFRILEQIAAYDWDLTTLPVLHLELARAMRDEERGSYGGVSPVGAPAR